MGPEVAAQDALRRRLAGGLADDGLLFDNVAGNFDDGQPQVTDGLYENFVGARVEAVAGRLLKVSEETLAGEAVAAAEADWQFAVAKLSTIKDPGVEPVAEHRCWRRSSCSARRVTASTLTRPSNWPTSSSIASRLPSPTGRCRLQDGSAKTRRRTVSSTTRTAVTARHRCWPWRRLCDALPDHADWARWYAAVALHSEYQRATAEFNRPYGVLPAGVYPVRENPAEVSLGVRLSETQSRCGGSP